MAFPQVSDLGDHRNLTSLSTSPPPPLESVFYTVDRIMFIEHKSDHVPYQSKRLLYSLISPPPFLSWLSSSHTGFFAVA